MGVDFYACENCGHIFPDCGDYFLCDCGAHFCCDECGQRKITEPSEDSEDSDELGLLEEVKTCIFCRLEAVADFELIPFLLKTLRLTRAQAVDMFRKEIEYEGKDNGE